MKIVSLLLLFILSSFSYGQNLTGKNISEIQLELKSEAKGKIVVMDNIYNKYFRTSNIKIEDLATKKELEKLKAQLEIEKKVNETLKKELNSVMKKLNEIEKKIK